MRHAAVVRSTPVLAAALAGASFALAAPAPRAAAPASTAASAPSPTLVDACPAQLAVKQTVSDTLAGWTPVNQQGSYPFQRVSFFPGSPGDAGASLVVPTVEYKGQTGLHDGWDLPHRAGGYWMACAYGNTTATVARKLADDVDFCQADYDGRFMTLVVKHWSCGVKRTMPPPLWGNVRATRTTPPKSAPRPAPSVRRGG